MTTSNVKDQNKEQPVQKKSNGGGDIVTDFIEDMWEVMTPELVEQLRCVLTEDMGLSKKDADKFIQCQRDINRKRICLKKGKRVVRIGPRNQWIKELSKDIADQMAMFVVGILLSDRTARTKKLTEKVLDHLCEITGEDTTVETAKTRIERTMVVVADRIATWIDENISDIEKKLKDFEKYKTAESLETFSVATLSTLRSSEIESSIGSCSDVFSEIASKTSSSITSSAEERGTEESEEEEEKEETDSDDESESEVEDEEKTEEEVEDEEMSEEEISSEEGSGKSSVEEAIEASDEEEDDAEEKSIEEQSGEEEGLEVKEEKEDGEEDSVGQEEKDEDIESQRLSRLSSVSAEIAESDEELCSTCKLIVAEEEEALRKSGTIEEELEVSEISSIVDQKKLPADILDLLKEDVVRIPKEGLKSERQRAMKSIIDQRFEKLAREKLSKSLDSVVKFDIDEAASIVANWVENILSSADDTELHALPDSPRQGPAFEIKQDKSQYEVHKLSSTTVAQKVAEVRGLDPSLLKKKLPRTMSPMNLKSAKDWTDWALGTAKVGEEWGNWLDVTLADAESKVLNGSSKRTSKQEKLQSWEAWRDSKGREAQKWRAEKQRIRDEGALWNRKLQKEHSGKNEKETKVLNY